MWILDASHRGSTVRLWSCDNGVKLTEEVTRPFFHMHLLDPHADTDMIEHLESQYGAEEVVFRTIYGELEGYKVYADRRIAELVERQSRFNARLYDVDVRVEQRLMAEKGLFPCGFPEEPRFRFDFDVPLTSLEIRIGGNPYFDRNIFSIGLCSGSDRRISGDERGVLSQLSESICSADPDILLFRNADHWLPVILDKARKYGLDMPFSRSGRFKTLSSRSYWSYGRMEHKEEAMIPEGRILIDTESSYTYRESGLRGVLLSARLTGLSPNLTARFTPGTLISGYEIYEAMRRKISIPFRKEDAERARGLAELRAADKGGMMFQPRAGVYDDVFQIDFTSLYPSIIVKYNLSPETLERPGKRGFLSEVLRPLLELRVETKRLKKERDELAEADSILKWMLVTSFGYTGYRNAKFGRIETHERITAIARDILLRAKEIGEDMGFEVLHGITDCLWLKGQGEISELKEAVEGDIGIGTELEEYDWIVFLPMADGGGAYNRYYGRLSGGEVKYRGIVAKRRDSPPYVARMQLEMLAEMGKARRSEELPSMEEELRGVHERYAERLVSADVRELVATRKISRLDYSRSCPEAAAVEAYRRIGVSLAPGMIIGYVVRDARRWIVDPEWSASEFDRRYYRELLDKAWVEIEFALNRAKEMQKIKLS
ncbi:MAG TPA: type B DNA-directed DNA polymerase [Euryarchaeota archaeon]|nr:type B DNA-directed DNA polymerase [Euryarchaeota archaeon]